MSLSLLIPARSGRRFTANCLSSTLLSVQALNLTAHVEYVLIDDASDPVHEIQEVFAEFRESCGAPCKIERLAQWSHYTGSFARAMEVAEPGNNLFLLSNDMQLTPDFLRTVLAVASLDPSIGIVRGRSRHCDSHQEYNLDSALPPRRWEDIVTFSKYVADHHGLAYREDKFLSGDAVYIKREVIDAVGIYDRLFFGYFADPDFGIRARRAGFKLVCAIGAWLLHEGAGHVKDEAVLRGVAPLDLKPERMQLVETDFQKFRAKYGIDEPREYDINKKMVDFLPWDELCKVPGEIVETGEFTTEITHTLNT